MPGKPSADRQEPAGAAGFFFAGSGTTPGVGVPMVLVSGKLAAQRVTDYLPAAPAWKPRPVRRTEVA